MNQQKRKMPTLGRQAWNLARSLADFVADGCRTVDRDAYLRRLRTCDRCNLREGDRCTRCGCKLSIKARGRAFQCPEGRWRDS